MEEQRSSAGQGLGIAGLVLGIIAIPLGIFPCTFYLGILFGVVGIVLALVAFSQANRGYGPKGLIIAALICSVIGLTFATVWGFTLSRGGARVIKEIFQDGMTPPKPFEDLGKVPGEIMHDMENESDSTLRRQSDDQLKHMTDTLKMLEGENGKLP